jgi:uncharacterized coiled-coil protein SlyX
MTHPDLAALETRLQESEIKLAFLEKELDEYKEAVQTLHHRLEEVTNLVNALRNEGQDSGGGVDGSTGFSG